MRPHPITSAAIGVVGLVTACASNPPPAASTPGVTNVQKTDASVAASQLAEAKCKHAVECNEIGGNKTYASHNACLSENRGKAENDLRASDCPHGVDASRLQACLSEVATESCSGFMSGFSRSMACTTGSLCP